VGRRHDFEYLLAKISRAACAVRVVLHVYVGTTSSRSIASSAAARALVEYRAAGPDARWRSAASRLTTARAYDTVARVVFPPAALRRVLVSLLDDRRSIARRSSSSELRQRGRVAAFSETTCDAQSAAARNVDFVVTAPARVQA